LTHHHGTTTRNARPITTPADPVYFRNAAQLRRWFARNADTASELVIGFAKARKGVPGITWADAVDEALCVGWIDGVRHRVDEAHYRIRFSPRKPGSTWSAVNIARVDELRKQGRMRPAGLAVFAQREASRSRMASYEQETEPELAVADQRVFQQNHPAWTFYQSLPPGYRRKVTW